ncbi:MAG: glycoside hydrolase family 127 protein, partial [Candidatus Hydrogenedentes bacterium]|nr:glycoside hydrolase family 127 protein [Candidatus Hydrogenedentota bacterium]
EHCGAVEWSITNEHLLRITGDVKFADAVERAIFNGYPAAKSPDAMTLAYMHSPNQLLATDWSGPQFDDPDYCDSKQYFSSAHSPLCCNVISHRAMPYFVDHMVMAAGDGLAGALYGPCSVSAHVPNAGSVELIQDTEYPFEDEIRITVNPQREAVFPLCLRIPAWCSSAQLALNGQVLTARTKPGKFAVLKRKWRRGDQVVLRMEVPITLETYPEGYVRVGGVAVIRGPLTYALPIPEVWKRFESVHNAPLSEFISDRLFSKRGAVWNYALIVDTAAPERSFQVRKLNAPESPYPWEHPKTGLDVKARRVLNWEQEGNEVHPMTPGLPFKPMKLAKRVETITLVPFGFTRLRMTYLPLVDGAKGGTAMPATLIAP